MSNSIESPLAPDRTFQRWFLTSLLIANGVALGLAELDRSWIAFGIAVVFGPILNGLFLLVGLIAVIARRKRHPAMPWTAFALCLIGGPIIVCGLISSLIFALGLHGC